jgi:hypothetical protein
MPIAFSMRISVPKPMKFANLRFAAPGCGQTALRHQAAQCEKLEPISKSPEEDNEVGELNETKEVLWMIFPSDEDPTLPLDLGEEAFDQPASQEASQAALGLASTASFFERCGAIISMPS